ncbi:HAMP domain-containing sensor histidine kinase [Streptomyces sp. NPDC093252]|uniref:HAMP domain-containing sensor histidine kinase n=1 Tax=Streptomyces sp. NPDC093252 TaxID=3154980 RepID=UPI00342DF06E
MGPRTRRPRRTRIGLRTRLVFAFLLVALVTAVSTAALTYREARNSVLQATQDTAVSSFRDQIRQYTVQVPIEPAGLQSAVRSLAKLGKPRTLYVFAEYGTSVRVSSGTSPVSTVVTDELRSRAASRPHGSFQRVVKDGRPYLVVGMPVVIGLMEHSEIDTGLVMYAVLPLDEERMQIDALVTAARNGALPGLAMALVPALLAARSVLRPVRELRGAALSMGSGRLDTRIPVKGRDELADLAGTFNESAAALERSVTELREAETRARRFASDVSHELRTPLAGMLAVTELLDEDAAGLDPDTARAVRLISTETGRLAVLVEDLMEISRFDARAAELNTDEVDVAETIRRTLAGRHWGDRVRTDLPDGIRARLDPRRFDVVIANLVGNALRHGATPVTVRLRREPAGADGAARLCAQVVDSGPGIRPEVLPYVFDRFFKADPARIRSTGSGLGLAITAENVRLHGGTIDAANRPDGPGAVFTVTLPLTDAAEAPEERPGPPEPTRRKERRA